VELCVSLCPCDVEFSAMDATRSDVDFLAEVLAAAVAAGATTINVPDTVGYALPDEYAALFDQLYAKVPALEKVVMSAHCHNDLGVAVANTLAAVERGATQVEVAINGIGERAGNAALEEVAMALVTRKDLMKRPCNIAWCPASLAILSRLTRPSWARTPSRMNRAYTRTECSRSVPPTRSCMPAT
jgi:isopropylmalate/homocitrate/citramalate synthase